MLLACLAQYKQTPLHVKRLHEYVPTGQASQALHHWRCCNLDDWYGVVRATLLNVSLLHGAEKVEVNMCLTM